MASVITNLVVHWTISGKDAKLVVKALNELGSLVPDWQAAEKEELIRQITEPLLRNLVATPVGSLVVASDKEISPDDTIPATSQADLIELSRPEMIQLLFLRLCKQYEQIGGQLKTLSQWVSDHLEGKPDDGF